MTTETDDTERAIVSRALVTMETVLFSRINPVPAVLEKGENSVRENETFFHYLPSFQGNTAANNPTIAANIKREKTYVSRGTTYIGEMPFPKLPEEYCGADRERFFRNMVETAQANEALAGTSVSAFVTYCVKTGKPVAAIPVETLHEAFKVHGEELVSVLMNAKQSTVHPAWVSTANLERLQELDPRGYVSYCFGIIGNFWLGPHNRNLHGSRETKLKVQAIADAHWSLARAYNLLGQVPAHKLPELATSLCTLLTYAPLSLRYLERVLGVRSRQPSDLAQSAIRGQLVKAIDTAITGYMAAVVSHEHAIKTAKFEELPETVADAAKGPSNIRYQQTSRNIRARMETHEKWKASEKRVQNLADKFDDILFGDRKPVKQNTEELRTRFAARPVDTTKAASLRAAFNAENADLSDIETPYDTFGDAGDDVVEMRRIPREVLEARNAEKLAEREREQATFDAMPRQFTLAERIAASRAYAERKAASLVAQSAPKQFATGILAKLAAKQAAKKEGK